jgi:hypothetical protein
MVKGAPTLALSDEPSDSTKRVAASRGPNWSDEESMKLIDAYKAITAEKDGLYTLFIAYSVRYRNSRLIEQTDVGNVQQGVAIIGKD